MIDIMCDTGDIHVPAALILSSDLTRATKLTWVGLTLTDHVIIHKRLSPTRISECICLSRQIVYKSIEALRKQGCPRSDSSLYNGKLVSLPIELLLDMNISIRAKLIYSMMRAVLTLGKEELRDKYISLSQQLNVGVKSLRKAVAELQLAGWLVVSQINRLAPLSFTFHNPARELFAQLLKTLKTNLDKARYIGETIMRGVLTMVSPLKRHQDNSAPDFLWGVIGKRQLQLDRLYYYGIAFEFNGIQHYRASVLYNESVVTEQRRRDIKKRELCEKNGVKLVIIRPQDLSLATIIQKVRGYLPMRRLLGAKPAVTFIEKICASYRRKSPVIIG